MIMSIQLIQNGDYDTRHSHQQCPFRLCHLQAPSQLQGHPECMIPSSSMLTCQDGNCLAVAEFLFPEVEVGWSC